MHLENFLIKWKYESCLEKCWNIYLNVKVRCFIKVKYVPKKLFDTFSLSYNKFCSPFICIHLLYIFIVHSWQKEAKPAAHILLCTNLFAWIGKQPLYLVFFLSYWVFMYARVRDAGRFFRSRGKWMLIHLTCNILPFFIVIAFSPSQRQRLEERK